MKTICCLLLTIIAIGCGGYQSSGTMAVTPAITQLMPNSASTGGQAFTLTVNGSNFASGSVVYWNGTTRTTTFVMGSQVTAAITATDIATAATVSVYVQNPGGTGSYGNQPGQRSNTVDFTVN